MDRGGTSRRISMHVDEELRFETPLLHQFHERRKKACQHILAAYTGQATAHLRPTCAALCTQRILSQTRSIEWLFLLALVSLSIFERPVWCIQLGGNPSPCETSKYPGWGHTYLPIQSAFFFEAVCLMVQFTYTAADIFTGVLLRRHIFCMLACKDTHVQL
jgi:hypothetical protein